MQTWAILQALPAGTVPVFNFLTEKILTPLLNFLLMKGKEEEGRLVSSEWSIGNCQLKKLSNYSLTIPNSQFTIH
jgi:hypothetical protein